MTLLRILLLPLCVLVAGCTVVRSSRTWETVIHARPDLSTATDPSAEYAEHLHGVLRARGVEHRVVTYQFRYTTRFREEAIGSRTAVLYRDDTHPTHPWWLAEERLARPRWLPNATVERQVSFAARHHAEILSVRDFPGSRDGKSVAVRERRATGFRTSRDAALRGVALGPDEADTDTRMEALFRRRHGSDFDPASALDRRKMAALQGRR